MVNVKDLKGLINLITNLDVDTLEEEFAVANDVIYLPIPKNLNPDALRRINEFGARVDEEDDCIRAWV